MKTVPKKKILIIGAGIAGLAACIHLTKNGYDAKILEARNRSGGRIWAENNFEIPFGRGASWIHGIQGNPLADLAHTYHTEMVAMDHNKIITYDKHGSTIPQSIIDNFNSKFDILLNKAKEIAKNAKQDVSLSDALSLLIKQNIHTSIEKDLFKTKLLWFQGYIGANYETLSGKNWDDEENWPGENCFLTSTYQPIIEGLTKQCQIQFNTIVKEINYSNKNIEVITSNKVFKADGVIVTLPLGTLKKNDVIFKPSLSKDKIEAIKKIGMGVFNLTAMKFPKSFWPKDIQAMLFTQFESSSISVFFTLDSFIHQPILLGTRGGDRARNIESLTDKELINQTMADLRKVFGSQIPEPKAFINTRWLNDPFSRGAYSYLPVGASSLDRETLAEPVLSKLFFAGEATSLRYPATTHGAYLSGIDAAKSVMKMG